MISICRREEAPRESPLRPFASALPDGDRGFSHSCKCPDQVLPAVNLQSSLIHVDDAHCSYPMKYSLIFRSQPHGDGSKISRTVDDATVWPCLASQFLSEPRLARVPLQLT